MEIRPLNSLRSQRHFYQVARQLYKKDSQWVCPLDKEVEANFKANENVFFQRGEAERWVAYSDKGKPVGRIAAFIDYKKAKKYNQPTGGIGYFECINDQATANALFDKARKWLAERGMEAMDGPINFGENYSYWGLLVDGFTQPGFGMPYHQPYYHQLFENYGFRLFFEQYSYHLDLKKPFPKRFWRIAEWSMGRSGIRYEHFSMENKTRFLKDLRALYNVIWADMKQDFTPMEPNQLDVVYRNMKNFLVPEFIWMAYDGARPVGFFIMLPDVNQAIKPLKGKFHLLNKIRFKRLIKSKQITRTRALVMGIAPKYHRSGIESAFFWHLAQVFQQYPQYREVELSWVGDFNPKMQRIYEAIGARLAKVHRTYRVLFDPKAVFERYPLPEVKNRPKTNNRAPYHTQY